MAAPCPQRNTWHKNHQQARQNEDKKEGKKKDRDKKKIKYSISRPKTTQKPKPNFAQPSRQIIKNP